MISSPTLFTTPTGPLLVADDLVKHYAARDGKGIARAVDGVSLTLQRGETLGIVGESGCGKSTLARLLLRLIEPTAGRIRLEGDDLLALRPKALRRRRRDMQIVFQDPFASLDPRMTIAGIIAEPLDIHGLGAPAERRRKVEDLLLMVGLDRSALDRYPHEFSGGQRQRIGIARAIALEPRLLILDEPVSALDVSIQSQILNLLVDLKSRLNLSYIFISHDLSVVEHVSDRVAVMYLGRIVEEGRATQVLRQPRHPYTEALVSAAPGAKGRSRIVLKGDPPSPEAVPAGCRFHPRCPKVLDICHGAPPPLVEGSGSSRVECHLYGEAGIPLPEKMI
ncbi:ABC transporter ATP-binding protein [Taklimakanibacter lacteus]|uniref:ABC transporter ATP-binding protein n=1 Tax=Taklimakanibacter lacteus TaxID=2268456 RepID=UPI000E674B88